MTKPVQNTQAGEKLSGAIRLPRLGKSYCFHVRARDNGKG